jgi:hypothetical protein
MENSARVEGFLDAASHLWESGAVIEKTGDTQCDEILAKMREVGREGVKQKLTDAYRLQDQQLEAYLAAKTQEVLPSYPQSHR